MTSLKYRNAGDTAVSHNRRISDRLCKSTVLKDALGDTFLKADNLDVIAEHAVTIRAKAGEDIIKEFTPAEYYYVLGQGIADVWHTEDGENASHVACLTRGDTFGEEGLIMGNHTATVVMRNNGVIFAIPKCIFLNHLYSPLLKEVEHDMVDSLMSEGWQLLDVRYDFELELFGKIDGCIHIPLHSLRNRVCELDRGARYITYCKAGDRSKASSVLLSHNGIENRSLVGGFSRWSEVKAALGLGKAG